MEQTNSRIIYFDVLRIIAAFAVVLSHVSSQKFKDCFPSDEWIVRMIYNSLGRWSVPVFVMISGALFLDKSKKINIKRLFSKNIARIIKVFLFWSFIYAIYDGLYKNGLVGFIAGTIHGPFHFWFLKMLLGLYVVVPILRAVVSDRKLELYFISVCIMVTFFIPMFFPIIGHYDLKVKDFIVEYYNSMGFGIVSGYIGYFVIGHYLSNYTIYPSIKKFFYLMGALGLLAVNLITYNVSYNSGAIYGELYGNLHIFTLFEASAIFIFIKSINIPKRYYSLIINVSKASLGIYLIHILVLHLSKDLFGIDSSLINPFFFIPVFTLLVFVVSFAFVSIIMRIPFMNRFVL